MGILIKYIVISLFISAMYGLFGDKINNGIVWLTSKIVWLWCILPSQIIWLLLFVLISLIIKGFYKLIK